MSGISPGYRPGQAGDDEQVARVMERTGTHGDLTLYPTGLASPKADAPDLGMQKPELPHSTSAFGGNDLQTALPRWEHMAESFYNHIAHGDAEHRAWLRRETEAWFFANRAACEAVSGEVPSNEGSPAVGSLALAVLPPEVSQAQVLPVAQEPRAFEIHLKDQRHRYLVNSLKDPQVAVDLKNNQPVEITPLFAAPPSAVLLEVMEALEAAKNGLTWYRDAMPEADSNADDEAEAQIDAAIAKLRKLMGQKT